ncbi:MAG: hypothetical protein K2O12_03310, partial [Muribaculaceae bacterium]|nr:hypothetical protein [Muribaculaceae bacterium]
MGFGLKLKKAFGLVSEEDNEFDDIISSAQPRSLSVSSTTATAQQTDDQMQETTEAPPADDPQLAA